MGNKVVYLHRKLDDKSIFYVGIGYLQRANDTSNRNRWWKNIVAKHGYEVEVLEVGLTWEQAAIKEIELIKLYGRRDKGNGILVNLTDGGEGVKGRVWTDEQRKNKSEFMKLHGHSMPKFPTEEHKRKLSISKIGNTNRVGKFHTEETKLRIGESKKGSKASDLQREIASKTFSKPILQYTLDGVFLREWSSQKEALIALKLGKNSISYILHGKIIKSHPYKWEWKSQINK